MIGICLGEDTGVGMRIVLGSSRASSNVRSVTASLTMSFCTGFTTISPVLPLHFVQYICMHALKHHEFSGRLYLQSLHQASIISWMFTISSLLVSLPPLSSSGYVPHHSRVGLLKWSQILSLPPHQVFEWFPILFSIKARALPPAARPCHTPHLYLLIDLLP